jgi:nitrogen fixation/metabolism regulation signal transduction histidine kinase
VRTQLIESNESPAIELSIEDNGGGVPPDLIDRLFEPYVTSKSKGTGLGLAIVKKIIEEHGGIITAENAEQGPASRPECRSGAKTDPHPSSQAAGEP